MKAKLLIACIALACNTYGQEIYFGGGGKLEHQPNKNTSCLTEVQHSEVIETLKRSHKKLKEEGKQLYKKTSQRIPNPKFIWPVKQADGFNYNNTWAISNYVDHDAAFPNQLKDYNNGTRTYDTNSGYNHQGIDIFSWPFAWKQMDTNQTIIIAAAAGQIIAKGDGQNDRSCSFNNSQWNAVYVQHNDGSVAWYGHLKNGSLTTKTVGDTVAAGEFIGVMGSSGNSTGPHLHFEVWTDENYTDLIDPFAGPENNLNSESWWQNQPNYWEPNINATLTHSAVPNFNTCPQQETTYEQDTFQLNDQVIMSVFLKDYLENAPINLRVLRPDGTDAFTPWTHTYPSNFNSGWFYWQMFPNVEGEWTWQTTYAGITIQHTFMVQSALNIEKLELEKTVIYPNPTDNNIQLQTNSIIKSAKIFNVLGEEVQSIKNNGITSITTEALSSGIYFLKLTSENNHKKTFKIIKK